MVRFEIPKPCNMKKKSTFSGNISYFLFFFLFFVAGITSFGQTGLLLKNAAAVYRNETIFIHSDKDNYVAGETIWLKTYLYAGMSPSEKSSSIKIQLISNDSNIISEKVYPVINGIAAGDIQIPQTVKEGRYFIRSYSNISPVSSVQQDYIMPIVIYNPQSALHIQQASYTPVPAIHFFSAPKIITGLPNQVYIDVSDQYNQPVICTGWLLSNNGDTINTFTTNEKGLSDILFTPAQNEGYKLVLEHFTIQPLIIPNKLFSSSGISLLEANTSDDYTFTLYVTKDLINTKVFLAGEYDFNLLFKTAIHLQNEMNRVKIPVSKLPAGINRIALLSDHDDCYAERFLFSNSSADKVKAPRINIALNLTDTVPGKLYIAMSDTAETTYSIGVTDDYYNFKNFYQPENILNRFYLTGFLKNNKPAYAGIIEDLSTANIRLINEVLASNQLLKPTWDEMKAINNNSGRYSNTDDSSRYFTLEGSVKPYNVVKAPKGSTLNLILKGSDSSLNYFSVPVDDSGNFKLTNLLFYDTLKVYYKWSYQKGRSVSLDLLKKSVSSSFEPQTNNYNTLSFFSNYPPVQLSNLISPGKEVANKQKRIFETYVKDKSPGKTLTAVTVSVVRTNRDKQREVEKKYTSSSFVREAPKVYDFINNPYKSTSSNVINYIRNNMFTGELSVKTDQLINPLNGSVYSVFIDEGRAFFQELENIDIQDIALIKIFPTNFVLADGNGPAIAVYTKRPEDITNGRPTVLKTLEISGYNTSAEFINPVANHEDEEKLYPTFYWNPSVYTNNTKKQIDIPFYNVNKASEATITIQGMSSDGSLFYLKKNLVSYKS